MVWGSGDAPTGFAYPTSIVNYPAGTSFDVVVVFKGCLSASCDGKREATSFLTLTAAVRFE